MFTLYNASAGSGKTTHLVIEYLTLCFQDIQKYRAILAITFTNNATAEMKNRIVETLETFSFQNYEQFNGSQKAIFDKIKTNLKIDDIEIKKRANALLENILYDYANFSITTIDSFFQRIIRSFALELGLNLNFNLEIELDELYEQTIDILLTRISKNDKSLSERVLAFVQNKLEETGNWNIEKDLLAFIPNLYNEKSYFPLKAFSDSSPIKLYSRSKILFLESKNLREKIEKLAEEGDNYIKTTNLESSEFHSGTTGIYSWFGKVKISDFIKLPGYTNVRKAIDKGSLTKKEGMIEASVHDRICQIFENIIALNKEYNTHQRIIQNLNSLILLVDLKQIMDEIKKRDNLFYLSETNTKIFDKIKDEDIPYIFEKLGNRYGYFFIDEFQDTSRMQWDDLLPLLKNALSQSYAAGEDKTGEVILFGDIKQAIYRFRNGDATLFDSLSSPEGYREIINPNDYDYKFYSLLSLDTNYRSYENVIEFNNRFFLFLKSITKNNEPVFRLAKNYYNTVEQKKAFENKNRGFVSVQFKKDKNEEDYLNNQVLNSINDARSRNFPFRDIAILTRGREIGNQLGKWLNEQGIPVISTESLLLCSSDKINVIISFLHLLINKNDKISLLFIIKYFEKEKLKDYDSAFYENLNTFFYTTLRKNNIIFEREKLSQLPLYSLVSELCRLFNFTESDAYIAEFLEIVFQYSTKKDKELIHFLHWWDEHKGNLSLSSAEGMDAVTILTIHKSKGLEYPIVILPLQRYSEFLSQSHFWYKNEDDEDVFPYFHIKYLQALENTKFEKQYIEEKEMTAIDNLNILYVAHTRAKKGLYIITGEKNVGNYSKYLSTFIDQNNEKFIFDEELNQYWFGEKNFVNASSNGEEVVSQFFPLSFYNFAIPQLKTTAVETLSEEQEIGIYVHNYLASLKEFPQTREEIESMAFQTIEPKYIPHVKQALLKIVSDEKLKPYFSNDTSIRVLNETTIVDAVGKLKRPDRIVFLPNEVVVIDYKTGKEMDIYQQQIDTYCHLLRDMGYQNVSGQIIYL